MNETEPLFDLTAAQVCMVLTDVIGSTVVQAVPQDSVKPKSGVSSEVCRVPFLCTTETGDETAVSVFLKRCTWKGRSEAVHYRYLFEQGVPTARLFGAVPNSRNEEVIFLEPLTGVGFQQDSESEWRSMLSLLAQFNACPISEDYALHLHPYEQVGRVGPGRWITGLPSHLTPDDLEAGWDTCLVSSSLRPKLSRAALALFARVEAQTTGMLHQDFMPDNFGWRGERTEMALFDLHKTACGPRFADVTPYLTTPDWSDGPSFLDSLGPDGVSYRDSLAQHYLNAFAKFGGPEVTLETFQAETADLYFAHQVTVLSWLAEQGQSERIQQVLDYLGTYPGSYLATPSLDAL